MAVIIFAIVTFAFSTNNQPTPNINPIKSSDLVKVSSPFGMRTHPITHAQKMHNGVDFIAELGTPVMATADGEVFSVDFKEMGYGNKVVIKHENGIKSLYAQLNEIKVEVGQRVNQMDIIGTVGSSGTSTGPHLHYEIMKDDIKVDPELYLSK